MWNSKLCWEVEAWGSSRGTILGWFTYCSDTCNWQLSDSRVWRQFQDFHLFCRTIIRASGWWLTLTTAAKAPRWKRPRADGSGESLQKTPTGSVKGRCVPTLPTPYQVLIYTYTVYKHHNHMWNTAFITQQHFNSTSCPQQQIINSPQKRGVWAQQLVHYTPVNNMWLLNIATPAFLLHFAA